MSFDDDFEFFDDIDRRIHAMMEQVFSGTQTSLFDVSSKSLKPLHKIEVTDEEVLVTFDLPMVRKEDVELTSTEDSLSIEAKMRRHVKLKVGGPFQRQVEFERYTKKIKLPVKVDPNRAEARFSEGMLIIVFPVAQKGRLVRVR